MILKIMIMITRNLLNRVIVELGTDRSSFTARGWIRYAISSVEALKEGE